jgi:2-(1,2-epoxy-1,2-dihydrophenyl)acetyl-CoA isomerase
MTFRTILLDFADGVATITLNRPERLNSFTEEMHAELRRALDAVEAPGAARALVLTGAGRAFSAGQDLTEAALPADPAGFDAGATLERNYNVMLGRLRRLPMPVIAAVNGIAAGAAANIALACDIVVAARSATFLQAFGRIGLIPDAGGTYLLPHHVGLPRAMGLALLAEPITADTAEQWGLIWKSVTDDEFRASVEALAKKLARGPTRAYALMKHALYAGAEAAFEAQLRREADLQRDAGRTADFGEGVRAFLEKREPRFTGN